MPEPPPNPGESAAWAGDRVARWLRQAAGLERQLAPVSELLFAAARVAPGESVLDVGCGTGPTTRDAARLAGPTGRVTGLDVSSDMLAAAAAAMPTGGAAVDWIEADAVTWAPPAGVYDVVLSRFGVMFFDDRSAAVGHLAEATRSGGRLAIAVWGPRPASPLFEEPYVVALEVLRSRGEPVEPEPIDAGPFSWHDSATVTALVESSGWHGVEIVPHRVRLPFVGGLSPADAAGAALDFGPTRLAVAAARADTVAAVRSALKEHFDRRTDGAGRVVLDAEIRIVSARR